MTMLMTERCCVCGFTRPLVELLRTHPRSGPGATLYVCRPTVDWRCFAVVPGRDQVRIGPADRDAPTR